MHILSQEFISELSSSLVLGHIPELCSLEILLNHLGFNVDFISPQFGWMYISDINDDWVYFHKI